MRLRLVGLALLALALLIHVGVTRPARLARDAAREGFAHQREERERLRAELVRRERRAAVAKTPAPAGDAAAARALRLSLLSATRGLALGDVQIAAQPDHRAGIAARGLLNAAGSQADLLRAAGRLAEPASGLRLERVQLVSGPAGSGSHRLEAETVSSRAGS
jgi:hypothetical protein